MKTVDLVYFNAGGGHRAAALALREVLAEQHPGVQVRLVNLFEVLDPRGRFKRWLGFAPEDFYNLRLRRGWTWGLGQELKLLQWLIRWAHGPMRRRLEPHWRACPSDLVVSLVPNFNRVLCESAQRALLGVRFVTVLTDLADHPPHFWIEPGLATTLVCGSPQAVLQARQAGYGGDHIVPVSGMVLRQAFYRLPPLDATSRAQRLSALGLDATRPVAVVMFGGHGSSLMLDIALAVPELQLLLMCGRNEPLAARLRALKRPAPQVVVGFTDEVAQLMRLGDFCIGKPGPGALSEALHLGLPVLTWRNASTLPQERYNTEWLQEMGAGLVLRSLHELPQAVQQMLARLPQLRGATGRLNNGAVFEISALLARLAHQPRVMPRALPALAHEPVPIGR